MKKFIIVAVILVGLALLGGIAYRNSKKSAVSNLNEKLYVAVEGGGNIAVVDPLSRKVLKYIDLSIEHEGGMLMYSPHNVQVSPDNRSVWVTGNAGAHIGHQSSGPKKAYAHGGESDEFDDVIVIDPLTDKIKARISVAPETHLAHVVLTPDSRFAYVTAQNEGAIYKIDAQTFNIAKRIETTKESEPH